VREEADLLDDVADAAPELVRRARADVDAVDLDRARRRLDEPVDHAQRGRLAAAGRTDEHDEVAARDLEVEGRHSRLRRPWEGLRQPSEGDRPAGAHDGERAYRCAPPRTPGPTLVAVATTVLLADDDERFRSLVRSMLVDDGYDVVAEAGDADAVLELAADRAPEVVVVDLVLPGAVGLSTVRALLAAAPHRPVLVLSSLFDPAVEQEAAELGATYLDKTAGVDALEEAIDAVVAARGGEPELD
jgi:two-component system chemotaxis response regulator CheY